MNAHVIHCTGDEAALIRLVLAVTRGGTADLDIDTVNGDARIYMHAFDGRSDRCVLLDDTSELHAAAIEIERRAVAA